MNSLRSHYSLLCEAVIIPSLSRRKLRGPGSHGRSWLEKSFGNAALCAENPVPYLPCAASRRTLTSLSRAELTPSHPPCKEHASLFVNFCLAGSWHGSLAHLLHQKSVSGMTAKEDFCTFVSSQCLACRRICSSFLYH